MLLLPLLITFLRYLPLFKANEFNQPKGFACQGLYKFKVYIKIGAIKTWKRDLCDKNERCVDLAPYPCIDWPQKIDPNLKKELPQCKGPGKHPSSICDKYYECEQHHYYWWKTIIKSCKKGEGFNVRTKKCEKGHICQKEKQIFAPSVNRKIQTDKEYHKRYRRASNNTTSDSKTDWSKIIGKDSKNKLFVLRSSPGKNRSRSRVRNQNAPKEKFSTFAQLRPGKYTSVKTDLSKVVGNGSQKAHMLLPLPGYDLRPPQRLNHQVNQPPPFVRTPSKIPYNTYNKPIQQGGVPIPSYHWGQSYSVGQDKSIQQTYPLTYGQPPLTSSNLGWPGQQVNPSNNGYLPSQDPRYPQNYPSYQRQPIPPPRFGYTPPQRSNGASRNTPKSGAVPNLTYPPNQSQYYPPYQGPVSQQGYPPFYFGYSQAQNSRYPFEKGLPHRQVYPQNYPSGQRQPSQQYYPSGQRQPIQYPPNQGLAGQHVYPPSPFGYSRAQIANNIPYNTAQHSSAQNSRYSLGQPQYNLGGQGLPGQQVNSPPYY